MTVSAEGHQEATALSDVAPMFGVSHDDLIAGLEALRLRLCLYGGGRCDCKFGGTGKGEQSGCPEILQAIAYLKGQHEQVLIWRERQEQHAVLALAAVRQALSAYDAEHGDGPHGPESPPVAGPARTVEVSDRTGRTDPDVP